MKYKTSTLPSFPNFIANGDSVNESGRGGGDLEMVLTGKEVSLPGWKLLPEKMLQMFWWAFYKIARVLLVIILKIGTLWRTNLLVEDEEETYPDPWRTSKVEAVEIGSTNFSFPPSTWFAGLSLNCFLGGDWSIHLDLGKLEFLYRWRKCWQPFTIFHLIYKHRLRLIGPKG